MSSPRPASQLTCVWEWWQFQKSQKASEFVWTLNENLEREVHPLPTMDEMLAQLSVAAMFSKLDANCGFCQIPLDVKSRPLATFSTPFGRFWFNKLPFGISSTPECFQRRMSFSIWMMSSFSERSTQKQHNAKLNRVI